MKKSFYFLGIAAIVAIGVCSCTNDIETEEREVLSERIPFTISLSADNTQTKTQWRDGMPYSIKFINNDAIRLFHAESGTTNFVDDGQFICASGGIQDVVFSGSLASALDPSKSYDWYAVYPYSEAHTGTPDDMEFDILPKSPWYALPNLGGLPLYGKCLNVSGAYTTVGMTMNQMLSAFKFTVTNNTENNISIATAKLKSNNHPLHGIVEVDLTKDEPDFMINGGDEIEFSFSSSGYLNAVPGGQVVFYLPFIPHKNSNKDYYGIGLGTDDGGIQYYNSKNFVINKDLKFEAGKVYPVNYSVTTAQQSAYISGSAASQPVCFPFCNVDNEIQNQWTDDVNVALEDKKFFSHLDLGASVVDGQQIIKDADGLYAWITAIGENGEAPNSFNHGNDGATRYNLCLANWKDKDTQLPMNKMFFDIHVKYSEIPAGKTTLAFYTGLSLGNVSNTAGNRITPESFNVRVSQDGGNSFNKPTSVIIDSELGSYIEPDGKKYGVLTVPYENRTENCQIYPVKVSFTPTATVNNTEFVIRFVVSNVAKDENNIIDGGLFGLAPYYEYDGNLRVYKGKNKSNMAETTALIEEDVANDNSSYSDYMKQLIHRSAYFVWE